VRRAAGSTCEKTLYTITFDVNDTFVGDAVRAKMTSTASGSKKPRTATPGRIS
jgi:hypothetical protein